MMSDFKIARLIFLALIFKVIAITAILSGIYLIGVEVSKVGLKNLVEQVWEGPSQGE